MLRRNNFNSVRYHPCCHVAAGIHAAARRLRAYILIRFHGVLAPNAKLRREIIPTPVEQKTERSTDDAHAQEAAAGDEIHQWLRRRVEYDSRQQIQSPSNLVLMRHRSV
jgi:hypothetical protein